MLCYWPQVHQFLHQLDRENLKFLKKRGNEFLVFKLSLGRFKLITEGFIHLHAKTFYHLDFGTVTLQLNTQVFSVEATFDSYIIFIFKKF